MSKPNHFSDLKTEDETEKVKKEKPGDKIKKPDEMNKSDKGKKLFKRITRKTLIQEDLLYQREVQWTSGKTAFVEFAYALYETHAVSCLGDQQSKQTFIHNMAEFFGISDIHTHHILHSKSLYKPIENHFPYKMEKTYEQYQEKLLEKGSLFDKQKKSYKEYFLEEDEAEESNKEEENRLKDGNAMAMQSTQKINEKIKYIQILLEEKPRKEKPKTQSGGKRKPPRH